MPEWQFRMIFALVGAAFLLFAVVSYLQDMKKRDDQAKKVCTERITGKIDRLASMVIDEGMQIKKRGPGIYRCSRHFSCQRNMFYRYQYDGKEYWGMDMRLFPAVFSTGKSGDYIELYCNPGRPGQFYCPAEDRSYKIIKTTVYVFMAAALLAIALAGLGII